MASPRTKRGFPICTTVFFNNQTDQDLSSYDKINWNGSGYQPLNVPSLRIRCFQQWADPYLRSSEGGCVFLIKENIKWVVAWKNLVKKDNKVYTDIVTDDTIDWDNIKEQLNMSNRHAEATYLGYKSTVDINPSSVKPNLNAKLEVVTGTVTAPSSKVGAPIYTKVSFNNQTDQDFSSYDEINWNGSGNQPLNVPSLHTRYFQQLADSYVGSSEGGSVFLIKENIKWVVAWSNMIKEDNKVYTEIVTDDTIDWGKIKKRLKMSNKHAEATYLEYKSTVDIDLSSVKPKLNAKLEEVTGTITAPSSKVGTPIHTKVCFSNQTDQDLRSTDDEIDWYGIGNQPLVVPSQEKLNFQHMADSYVGSSAGGTVFVIKDNIKWVVAWRNMAKEDNKVYTDITTDSIINWELYKQKLKNSSNQAERTNLGYKSTVVIDLSSIKPKLNAKLDEDIDPTTSPSNTLGPAIYTEVYFNNQTDQDLSRFDRKDWYGTGSQPLDVPSHQTRYFQHLADSNIGSTKGGSVFVIKENIKWVVVWKNMAYKDNKVYTEFTTDSDINWKFYEEKLKRANNQAKVAYPGYKSTVVIDACSVKPNLNAKLEEDASA
ncbi:uncharacterized protein LOC120129451 [Hibiscus syriacus]|uniref:uncharacterized protein LOC120129451 n=1 Tax=Hibiscus syriacus TaxID=106335 RepID=UPI00192051E6|nr:uncharacterized protein LOC120129451 [Hibiscus syriacus]